MRHILKSRGYSMHSFAKMAGVAPSSVHNAVTGDGTTTSTATRYVSLLGYRVALVPSGSRMPEGCIRLDSYREPDASGGVEYDLDDPNLMIG